jgi:hypothetical protein
VTSTPQAYDLSDVQIGSEDLPAGFMPFDLSAFGMDESTFSQGEYEIENFTFFLSMLPPEFVFSFLVQAHDRSDQAAMDLLLDNPEIMLNRMTSQVGEVKEQRVWTDVPEVGEKAAGVSVVLDMDGQNFEMDMLVFRRASVAVFVARMYPADGNPRVSVPDIATLLDQRLQNALKVGTP